MYATCLWLRCLCDYIGWSPKRWWRGPGSQEVGEEKGSIQRYTVTTSMTPVLRWAAMRALSNVRDNVTTLCSRTTTFEEKGEPNNERTNSVCVWCFCMCLCFVVVCGYIFLGIWLQKGFTCKKFWLTEYYAYGRVWGDPVQQTPSTCLRHPSFNHCRI